MAQYQMPTEALPPHDHRYPVSPERTEAQARAMLQLIDTSRLQKRHAELPELSSEIATLVDKVPDDAPWWNDYGLKKKNKRRRRTVRRVVRTIAEIIHKEALGTSTEVAPEAPVNSEMFTTFTTTAACPTRAALQTQPNDQLSLPTRTQQSGFGETEVSIPNQVAWTYGKPVFGSKHSVALDNKIETEIIISADDAYTDSKSPIVTTTSHVPNVFKDIQLLRQDIAHLTKEVENTRADARELQGKIRELSRIVVECKEAQDHMEKRALDIEVELFLLKLKLPDDDIEGSKRKRAKIENTPNDQESIA